MDRHVPVLLETSGNARTSGHREVEWVGEGSPAFRNPYPHEFRDCSDLPPSRPPSPFVPWLVQGVGVGLGWGQAGGVSYRPAR